MTPELPFAPYDGTGGHAGTEASQHRAEREAEDGTLKDRQKQVLAYLEQHGVGGITWGELGLRLGLHHGQVSGTLSNLHQGGMVFMLRKRHNRSHPYVHVKYRDFYSEEEVHDAPKRTRAGDRKRITDNIINICRQEVAKDADGFDEGIVERIRVLLADLDAPSST
jgi:hypothetical protein